MKHRNIVVDEATFNLIGAYKKEKKLSYNQLFKLIFNSKKISKLVTKELKSIGL